MWDDQNLYVLADIQDEDITGENEKDTYQNDSMEVYIDEGREGSSPYDDNDVKVNVDYMERMSGTNIPDGVQKAVRVKKSEYLVEVAIPWSTITPEEGTQIGFDTKINDALTETGSRSGYLGWNDPLEQVWKDKSMTGILELVDNDHSHPHNKHHHGNGNQNKNHNKL